MPVHDGQMQGANGPGADHVGARSYDELSPARLRELAAEIVALLRADLRHERERLGPPANR